MLLILTADETDKADREAEGKGEKWKAKKEKGGNQAPWQREKAKMVRGAGFQTLNDQLLLRWAALPTPRGCDGTFSKRILPANQIPVRGNRRVSVIEDLL